MTTINYPTDNDITARLLGTSALKRGCEITFVGNTITVATGEAVFNYVDQEANLLRSVNAIIPEITDTPPTTSTVLYIYLTENLTLEYDTSLANATTPNSARIQIGTLTYASGNIITAIDLTDVSQTNVPEAIRDLQYTMRPLRKQGVDLEADAVNPMKVAVGAGQVLYLSGAVKQAAAIPGVSQNILEVPAFTIPQYNYLYRDGAGGWILSQETEIIPDDYDDGSGTPANVTGWSVQKLYGDASFTIYVQYGQEIYRTFREAFQGMIVDPVVNAPLVEGAYFAGHLIIRTNCSDLNNDSRCAIILPPFVNGEHNVTKS